MNYLNFDLEAFAYNRADDVESFSVRVSNSPVGQMRLGEAEPSQLTSDHRLRARRLDARQMKLEDMIEFGQRMADALFPGRVREFLERSRAKLGVDDGLRIRLRLDTVALSDMPWEYVYVPKPNAEPGRPGPDGFLALDRAISLVRFEVIGQPVGTLDPVGNDSLRMVALLAGPQSNVYPALNLDKEAKIIQMALGGQSTVRSEVYDHATIDTLQDALVRNAHIFHFSGHGVYRGDLAERIGSTEGTGFIVLENPDGGAVEFPSDKLALTLAGRGVRMAFLNACEGGRTGGVTEWSGVVPALTRAGIPAVIGMQFRVRDDNAIAFSRRLYRALAAGNSIDAAVQDGRLAIFNQSADAGERDWGVPAVYLRAEDGVLFPRQPATPQGSSVVTSGGNVFQGPVNVQGGDFVGGNKIVNGGTPATTNSTPSAELPNKTTVRNAMIEAFSSEELSLLCDDLSSALQAKGIRQKVDLETVGGGSKPSQVLNLIQYMDRRGWYDDLIAVVRAARPGIF